MPQIRILDKEISELIAAGEVIERPASVIKEAVENAIDAGARHITVEIQNGGIAYMRIVDDGCGMAPEEVATAFERHATSKVSEKEDLNRIFTLGFRGEALASIAAVARVTVLTKRRDDALGTSYTIEGSIPGETEQTGCPDGTTLIIRDLFYNVPVRRKFLRKDVAEANAVSQIVRKIALSHPEISFRLLRDNRPEFRTDGSGDLYTAIYTILGREFAHDLIPVDEKGEVVSVRGYAGKPLYAKTNRSFQHFFVNGRYVRSRQLSTALENAYLNLIMIGKFPTCVLMIDLPPVLLDVNIHPTKEEVRFSDEKKVMDAVYFAVRNALLKNGLIYDFQMDQIQQTDWTAGAIPEPPQQFSLRASSASAPPSSVPAPVSGQSAAASLPSAEQAPPAESFAPPQAGQPAAVPPQPVQPDTAPVQSVPSDSAPAPSHAADDPAFSMESPPAAPPPSPVHASVQTAPPPPAPSPAAEQPPVWEEKPKLHVLGEVFKTYIVAEDPTDGGTLILFDKHAAHERVMFEQIRSGAYKQMRQILLRPVELVLAMDEFSAVESNLDQLDRMGFTIDCSTPPVIRATAVPPFALEHNTDEVLEEIAHNLALGKINPATFDFQDMVHTLACKSAIRAGETTSLPELTALAQQVYDDINLRHCPHGRPIMFVIRKYDLEKQFKRIQS